MIDYFKLVEGDALPLPPQPDPQPDTGEDLDACPAASNCPDARPRVGRRQACAVRQSARDGLNPSRRRRPECRPLILPCDDLAVGSVQPSHTGTHTMTEIEKVLYTAKAHTSGGREGGVSRSSDGRLVSLRLPAPRVAAPTPSNCSPLVGRPVS
jgi:hypothetical protein